MRLVDNLLQQGVNTSTKETSLFLTVAVLALKINANIIKIII